MSSERMNSQISFQATVSRSSHF